MSARLSYEIRREAEELESLVKADPGNYFAQGWLEAAKALRVEAQAKYEQERDSVSGKTYNTFTDQWE